MNIVVPKGLDSESSATSARHILLGQKLGNAYGFVPYGAHRPLQSKPQFLSWYRPAPHKPLNLCAQVHSKKPHCRHELCGLNKTRESKKTAKNLRRHKDFF